MLDLEPASAPTVRHAGTLLLILCFGWLLISLISVLDECLRERLASGARDDRRAKRVVTRVTILSRVLIVVILVLTAAAMLVTFPEGRAIGTSILASAGIAGLVLGPAEASHDGRGRSGRGELIVDWHSTLRRRKEP